MGGAVSPNGGTVKGVHGILPDDDETDHTGVRALCSYSTQWVARYRFFIRA